LESQEQEPKTFIARVQVGYRIQIPEPVRELLDIKEEDIVEVSIRKLKEEKKEPISSDS